MRKFILFLLFMTISIALLDSWVKNLDPGGNADHTGSFSA